MLAKGGAAGAGFFIAGANGKPGCARRQNVAEPQHTGQSNLLMIFRLGDGNILEC
jgi:hypothetical protein